MGIGPASGKDLATGVTRQHQHFVSTEGRFPIVHSALNFCDPPSCFFFMIRILLAISLERVDSRALRQMY